MQDEYARFLVDVIKVRAALLHAGCKTTARRESVDTARRAIIVERRSDDDCSVDVEGAAICFGELSSLCLLGV